MTAEAVEPIRLESVCRFLSSGAIHPVWRTLKGSFHVRCRYWSRILACPRGQSWELEMFTKAFRRSSVKRWAMVLLRKRFDLGVCDLRGWAFVQTLQVERCLKVVWLRTGFIKQTSRKGFWKYYDLYLWNGSFLAKQINNSNWYNLPLTMSKLFNWQSLT